MNMKTAKRYARKIIEYYKAFNVPLDISWYRIEGTRMVFKIKFLPGTTENKIRTHLGDIKQALELQLFQLHREGINLFFVAAEQKFTDNRLLRILTHPTYPPHTQDMLIPYPIGFDVMGKVIIVDLASLIHLLIGGSSHSGKTIGLRCLITSIVGSRSSSKVNLIIFDGASNLNQFNGIPHLCCPIIQDSETGLNVILALSAEMERRIAIKNSPEFHQHPRIVCIIDEFQSFISMMGDKQTLFTETVTGLLRRGRHANINIVLAAHDPTVENVPYGNGTRFTTHGN
jgi:S-DNA-T family DNA segregation ATPase FtsK/SpoIIIE